MKHLQLTDSNENSNFTLRKIVRYSIIIFSVICILALISFIIYLLTKSPPEFSEIIDKKQSIISINKLTNIIKANETYLLQIKTKSQDGLFFKDGPDNLLVNLSITDSLNLKEELIETNLTKAILNNELYYVYSLNHTKALDYQLKVYLDNNTIGNGTTITVIPNDPSILISDKKVLKDIGNETIIFTVKDNYGNDILKDNKYIKLGNNDKLEYELKCLDNPRYKIVQSCFINYTSSVFNCTLDFDLRSYLNQTYLQCNILQGNNSYSLEAKEFIQFSSVLTSLDVRYTSNNDKITVDAQGGRSHYELPLNKYKLQINSENECNNKEVENPDYIKEVKTSNLEFYEIKYPDEFKKCSYYKFKIDNENGGLEYILLARSKSGKLNAEQKAIDILSEDLVSSQNSLYFINIARRQIKNFYESIQGKIYTDAYAPLYLSVQRYIYSFPKYKFGFLKQIYIIRLNYTEVNLNGEFSILSGDFESNRKSSNLIFYNTTFTTFSSAGFTDHNLYFTKDFNILEMSLNVKNQNQVAVQLSSSVNEFGNIDDVRKEFSDGKFFDMVIQFRPEELKERTLISYIFNKDLNNPDFVTNVKNKNKAFYQGNGKLENILEYVLVNIWDRLQEDYIYSNIIKSSIVEGKLRGKGEILLPYGESDTIENFNDNDIIKVSINIIIKSPKNVLNKINMFFLKNGFNPIYYTDKINFKQNIDNSSEEVFKAEQILVDNYGEIKKALIKIIQQPQ